MMKSRFDALTKRGFNVKMLAAASGLDYTSAYNIANVRAKVGEQKLHDAHLTLTKWLKDLGGI